MSLSSMNQYRTKRRGVTLIEVMFSMSVILIGLVGLLTLLPLAGFRARDVISLNVGAAMADGVLDQFKARHYHTNGRLWTVKASTGSPQSSTVELETTIPDVTVGFCIDPMLASFHTSPSSVSNNGYGGNFFPYYKATHNPLLDPLSTSNLWPFPQPRMLRAGITRPAPNPTFLFLDHEQARSIAESVDDLPVTQPQDKSLPARFDGGQLQILSGGSLEYGKRVSTGDFSTLVTVSPLPGGVYASATVVVMRKRDRSFQTPIESGGASTVDDNALGERLAYVTYGNGFHGGAGGIVHLVASSKTNSTILNNSWIMLSRRVPDGVDENNNPHFIDFHRWYRVASITRPLTADGKPEKYVVTGTSSQQDANFGCYLPDNSTSNDTVWRQKILLDGPDWDFGFYNAGVRIPYGDDTFADNTFATLVDGVVSVTERIVRLDEL